MFKNDGSLQIISVSENASSPTAFEYRLQMPEGTSVLELPDGGYALQQASGDLIGLILAPWAVDANGVNVPTRYDLTGSTLTQHLDLGNPGISFPVVADPTIYYFWWGYGVKYTRAETAQIANAGSFAAFTASLCGLLPGPVKALCIGLAVVFFGLYIGTFVLAKNQGKCTQVNYPYAGIPVPAIAYVVNC